MNSNMEILRTFDSEVLRTFVAAANSGKVERSQVTLSKQILETDFSLGFCRRLKVMLSSDEQYIARKVAEVVKLYLSNLPVVTRLPSDSRLKRVATVKPYFTFQFNDQKPIPVTSPDTVRMLMITKGYLMQDWRNYRELKPLSVTFENGDQIRIALQQHQFV